MENASKALIIAGAILLSILIIGLGMAVYNNASSSMGSANLDSQEISAHNSQFLSYEGKQKGSQVNSLINTIKRNNKEYADRQVKIFYSGTTDANTGFTSYKPDKISADSDTSDVNGEEYNNMKISNKTTYFINFNTGSNGIIDAVDIHIYSQAD